MVLEMKEQRKSDLHCRVEIGLALQKNNELAKLNLSTFCLETLSLFIGKNGIGDEGAKEIGLALQSNNALTALNLGMLFAQHYSYSSQSIIKLDIKEEKKSDLHCRRIRP
eukprot:TRINITY_DN832_c0_g1_i7.p2 TRINITY_DN832_c0_g1~~TRINITY_DN832_c0_g1_i7.p2  ORF type:complete len:117 (-),score=11.34 TRINITY_DN832_c0_g1_i7:43-372(-)